MKELYLATEDGRIIGVFTQLVMAQRWKDLKCDRNITPIPLMDDTFYEMCASFNTKYEG